MRRTARPVPLLVPPRGSRASTFSANGEEFLVLSYPLGRVRIANSLTRAEQDVAEAFVRGCTMVEIAKRRRTTRNTVANQLRAVYAKLGAKSRLDLARMMIVD